MNRRTLLRGVAGLLAGAGLAGCTGAGGEVPVTAEPPPSGIATETDSRGGDAPGSGPASGEVVSVVDYGGRADADGSLVVTVTVENESAQPQVRLVRATVEIEELQTVGERFVQLAPGESRTVRIHLDVEFEAWNATGSLAPAVVRATPATPIPTDRETPTDTPRGAGQSPTPTQGTDTRSETGTTTDAGTGTPSEDGTDAGTTESGTPTE